jgi:hypothetical protein
MAEPGRAKTDGFPTTDPVTINHDQTSGYSFTPPTSQVAYNGTVQFVTSRSCWVWTWVGTTPTNVFEGQTGYYVNCPAGGQNDFVANVPSITITMLATDPNSPQPPPPSLKDSVKGSITVGSMGEHHKHD